MATGIKGSQSITVSKLHPVIGAQITGVDLSQNLDDETIGQIKQAWYDHTVLLFRDQDISEDDQLRFAGYFGTVAERVIAPDGADKPVGPEWTNMLMVTDKVDENGEALGALGHGEMCFHADKAYIESPHRASFLYGIEVPSEGGHTKFSSLYASYDNMPDEWKTRFEDAFVMHGYNYNGKKVDLDINLDSIMHFRQPMVLANPDSGRKGLFLSRLTTMWIDGLKRDESQAILDRLFELTENTATIYEHVWRPGDLVMWDNFSCLHARTDWPDDQRRALRRCTIEGAPLR